MRPVVSGFVAFVANVRLENAFLLESTRGLMIADEESSYFEIDFSLLQVFAMIIGVF